MENEARSTNFASFDARGLLTAEVVQEVLQFHQAK
jgi:hypothetical protein